MRTNLLNDLSNVVKKGAGLACSWSQVGRMLGEGAIEHPLSTHSAPFGTRWKPAGNKYSISMRSFTRLAAMITLLLTLACGNVWGADFTPAQIVANSGAGTTTDNIKVSSSYTSTENKKLCASQTSVAAVSIASSEGQSYDKYYVEIQATTGTIGTLSVNARGNSDGTANFVAVFWTGNASGVCDDKAEYAYINRTSSDCEAKVNITVPANTKTIRLYRRVCLSKSDGKTFASSNKTDYGNGSTTNIFGITATLAGKCTLSYDANGGTGSMPSNDFAAGTTVYAAQNAGFTAPSGKIFKCWNTQANGEGTSYSEWASFTLNANTTLYAQWITASTGSTYCISMFNLSVSNQMKYFTFSGYDDMQILDLEVPSYNTGGDNFWVGKNGSWYNDGLGNSNAKSANERLENLCLKSNRGVKLGTASQGVLARFYIYDNSTYDNLMIEFTPKQYSLIWGSGGDWTPVKLYPSGNDCEWTSEVVSLTSDQISSYNYYVGIQKADNGVAYWYKSNTLSVGSMGTYNKRTATWGGNVSTLSAGTKGFFRMWHDATSYDNWRCHFVPVYTLSYNANEGSGAPANAYTATEGDDAARTIKVSMTEPTRNGYSFEGWATSSANASAGTVAYAPGASITLSADQELWAVWACVDPTIGTDLSESQVDYNVGDAATALTVAATAAGGSVSYQWYSNSAKSTSSPTPTSLTTGTSYTPSTAAAGTTYYFCKITNSTAGCSNVVYSKIAKIVVSRINPTQYTVSGTASICAGGNTDITLSGSQTGASYQLKIDGVATGDAKAGTGSALTWNVSTTGTYTVSAVQTTKYNARDMSGSATVSAKTATSVSFSDYTLDATVDEEFEITGISAAGDGTLTYQWYSYSDAEGTGEAEIDGAESSTYTFTPDDETDYYFKCEVTGTCGSVKSSMITVTATSSATTYSVTYSKGDATGGTAPSDATAYDSGDEVTVKDTTGCKFVYAGHTFRGWTDGTTFYLVGQKFNITSNVTLTAVWDAGASGGCETYFWFNSATDASNAGVTNSSKISTTLSTSANEISGSITIDGTEYTVTARTSNSVPACTIVVPSDSTGTFYMVAVSSGTGTRTVTTKKGDADAVNTDQVIAGSKTEGTPITIENLDPGTYVISATGNIGVGMMALKLCSSGGGGGSSNYYVAFANQTGFGGSTTLPDTIKGVPSGKKIAPPSDPTASGYTFGGWYSNAACTAGNEVNLSTMTVTADKTIYAKWCANHTVAWVVNGSAYSTGTPTTATTDCDGITTMPTAPADNTLSCANSFRGWSATNLYGEATNTQPADLFVTAGNAPTINADKTFYAVFGTATSAAYVGTVLWSEDWTGAANNSTPTSPTASGSVVYGGASVSYAWTNGVGTNAVASKVTTSDLGAGGVSPEAQIGKKGSGDGAAGGYLTVSGIPLGGAKTVTVEYLKNNRTIDVSYYLDDDYTGHASVTSATSGSFDINCSGKSTLKLKFEATTTNTVRLDNIVVKIKEDGATGYRCICPSLSVTPKLVTESTPIFITSAASKTVRSQDSLRIVGSGLQKNATLSISSPASKFALKSGKNGVIQTDATGSIDTVAYIYYTPGEGETSDGLDKNNSFTITDGTNSETVSQSLIGRHLPADFVIAAKSGDKWYALPANMGQGDAASTRTPVEITVDDSTTPTLATTSQLNVYSMIDVPTAVQNRDSGAYVILWMHAQDRPLYGNQSTPPVGSSNKYVINNLDKDYWWALTQKNTSITNAADATYNISVANGNTNNPLKIWLNAGGEGKPYWGLYSSASNIITEIRLIPRNCSDPSEPTISGETEYAVGQTISLTATCASGTEEGTTYTWYKGATWEAAKATTPVKSTSVSGATFTKIAKVSDAGTYWCEVANGTNCKEHNSTGYTIDVPLGDDHVLIWNMTFTSGASSLYNTHSESSTSSYLTSQTTLAVTGITLGSDGASEATPKLENSTSEDNSKCAYVTFAVESGYQFIPDSVILSTTAVANAKNIVVELGRNKQTWAQSQSESSTPTKHNYTFSSPKACTGAVTLKIHAYASNTDKFRIGTPIKIYGTVEAITGYTVTYEDGGATSGSVPEDASSPYDEGATVTVLGNTGSLARNGYEFNGWSDGVNTYSAGNTFTMPDENVTLTAQWTPNTYGITYHLNGASWASAYSAPATYTVGTGATLPVAGNMTNTGYSFNGWKNNSGLTGDNITAIGTSDYGDKEFWAKWTENTYTITYNANGDGAGNVGDVTGSTSSTNGHYVTVADNGFALENHVFAGWNTAANGSGESYSEGEEIELTANMTLYAIWASDYTITWGNVQIGGAGDAVTPNLGGGNYTITASVADWTGSTGDIELGTVTDGVTAAITGTTASTVTITFDVTAAVVGEAITLTLDIPAHGSYGAKSAEKEIGIDRCDGGSYVWDFSDREAVSFTGQTYSFLATDGTTEMRYTAASSSEGIVAKTYNKDGSVKDLGYLKENGNSGDATVYDIDGKTAINRTRLIRLFITGTGRLKIDCSANIGKFKLINGSASGTVLLAEYKSDTTSAEINVTTSPLWIDTKSKGYINKITWTASGGSGKISPTLTWSPAVSSDEDWDSGNNRLNKKTSDADFTFTASTTSNTLGAITYESSNTSVVTVSETGKVHMVGAGNATITATLAESGCYKEATASYNIAVTDDCDDEAGTISTEDLGCDGIRLTVTGHTAAAGVSYQWYKVKAEGSDDEVGEDQDNYTATTAGEYYVIVTNTGDRHCAKTSTNTVVVAAKAAVTASKIVDSWYVKNGRRTPDIALVQTTNTTDFTVAFKGSTTIWDPTNSVSTGFGGCPFHMSANGIIYLDGQSSLRAVPTGMTVGDTTITITAKGCGAGNNQSVDIKLHVQAATDYPSVAYVSLGTAAGAVTDTTAGYYKTAALYKYLDNTLGGGDFDLTAQNAYWSVDEKELKQHYSQFDAILITDDPSTDKSKKVDGKDYSYINAIGCLIDVRPILTMEAYVAKRDNWKAKGITGTPESPNPRQYGMKLQCKQHAIFSGVNPASSNVEVETIDGVDYWTVLMVDSTMSPYTGVAWNEQTAGDKKPALQGFAASSVSEDLLLLGEIKDGALYAGVERQTEPAARLLVLGINAKALPSALTAEGKLILENSLHYLLETDLEKVDDCSNYFTGATDSDWNKATNWSKGQVPNSPTIRVRILKPCVVSSGTPIKAASVDIATSGKSYHLSGGTCSGKLTINAGGALIVGGEVRSAVAPNFNSVNLKPTTEDDLILNTSGSAQSALILNNDDGDTKATVNLYSLGRYKDDAYQFQYFAVPMTYLDVNPAFAGQGIYTYVWTEASRWERRGYYKGLEAFEGVGITTTFTEAKTYQMKGTLASTEEREITLTAGGLGNGQNIVGNSWLAPINIASLCTALDDDANIVDKTIYIYCTGNDGGSVEYGVGETPGQWLAIPIDASGWPGWGGLKVIPAMQGFCIIANSETTLTLNYNDHVRSTASDKLTPYLRAPKRNASHEGIDLIRIRVADSQTHTDLYLFEGESFSEEFDNGWEAKYLSSDGRSAKLYAETAIGPMAVVAQPEYEGTVLGFAPGKETEYTFTFSGPNKEYYLNDLKEKKSTLISEDESYMFTFEEGDTNRFYISKTPINAPSVATGTENTGDGAKARKVIYNNHVYIIRAGKVYGIDGTLVVPNMEQK